MVFDVVLAFFAALGVVSLLWLIYGWLLRPSDGCRAAVVLYTEGDGAALERALIAARHNTAGGRHPVRIIVADGGADETARGTAGRLAERFGAEYCGCAELVARL